MTTGRPLARRLAVEGTVRDVLPRALYRIGLDDGRQVTAHAPGGPERNFVRLVVGDRVVVELASRDLGRGRIVRAVRNGHR